ncbi:MAG: hypothetical protein WAU01_17175, partial [Saprospiraceae bacterium]
PKRKHDHVILKKDVSKHFCKVNPNRRPWLKDNKIVTQIKSDEYNIGNITKRENTILLKIITH